MSSFHQDSEAIEAIRDRQQQGDRRAVGRTSDVAGRGEGVSDAQGASSHGNGAKKDPGKGKGMSTILCCLCGRPIQPNGEETCLNWRLGTFGHVFLMTFFRAGGVGGVGTLFFKSPSHEEDLNNVTRNTADFRRRLFLQPDQSIFFSVS